MSLMKFFGEQGDEHGGQLFWSGALQGLPFRGPSAPTLTRDELQDQVEVHWDFKFHEFDLNDEKDRAYYQYVKDRAINGWFYVHHQEYAKDQATGRIRYVYVEWSQRYGQLSPAAPPALRSHGYAINVPANGAGFSPAGESVHRLAGMQGPADG